MNILIATDSYKGCISSLEAGQAIAKGVLDVLPDAHTRVLIVSDGGEGMSLAFKEPTKSKWVDVEAHDPLMRPLKTRYIISPENTAYIELAAASGLTLLKKEERNPMLTSTFGTGEMIADAVRIGAQKIIVGLGGSATNDGAMGILYALGVRFYNIEKKLLEPCGKNLLFAEKIDTTHLLPKLKNIEIISASDVISPLYGPQGAAYVFATQKGANEHQVYELDLGLHHYGRIIYELTGHNYALEAGAGAAGGAGVGLISFLKAKMHSGINLLLHTPGFEKALNEADLILTGEGQMDSQSTLGKATWGLLEEAKKRHKPIYAVAGRVVNRQTAIRSGFQDAVSATPRVMPLKEATKPEVAVKYIRLATSEMLHRNII